MFRLNCGDQIALHIRIGDGLCNNGSLFTLPLPYRAVRKELLWCAMVAITEVYGLAHTELLGHNKKLHFFQTLLFMVLKYNF